MRLAPAATGPIALYAAVLLGLAGGLSRRRRARKARADALGANC